MTPQELQALSAQAMALHQAGRLPEAEQLYLRIRAADPGNFTANYLMGVIQHGRGEFGPALASMDAALAANPGAPNVLLYRGLLLEAHHREKEALASYNRALLLQPGLVGALVNRGSLLNRLGRSGHALADFESALRSRPDFVPALFGRGTALEYLERWDEALACYGRVLALDPNHLGAMGNRGTVLRAMKRPEEALAAFNRVLSRAADNAVAHYNRGVALMDLGRPKEALSAFDRALAIQPDLAIAHGNRAAALRALGRAEEALKAYALAPQDFITLSEKGKLLHDLQRFAEALKAYDQALAIQPDAMVMNNRGGALQNLRQPQDARAAYSEALRLNPDLADARSNRAMLAWQHFKDHQAASDDLEALLRIDPYHDYAVGNLLHLRMLGGNWRPYASLRAVVEDGVRAGKRAARPFVFQALSASPADLQRCSQIYTAGRYPAQPPLWKPRAHDRIRVGYLCGEFREQATAVLTAGLFECHDIGSFELYAFDNGWSDHSPMRARLEAALAHFMPIADLTDRAAAEAIAAAEVDVLVNLNGYFGLGRMGIFSHKPAPVQVNYLGFPATLGAPYMDYILVDKVVIPEGEQRFYDEQVVWLPGSYQVNDNRRAIGPATTRATHGLPEDTFVFCNFNHSYKLTPPMFDSWMRILSAVPASALWLWNSNPGFLENMRREAEARGVARSRLIFADTVHHADHLARLQLADLAIDSLPYNAHTTASDALWAGLPLLTCRGTAFPGRVAASLLAAIGLPELITESLAEFETRAIHLATAKDELAGLRTKLAQNRATTALFDTARTTRNIERAYAEMWEKFQRGETPSSFAVPDQR